MNSRADLAVYNSEGVLKIVVDIKGRHGTTSEWATHTRRNMAAHGNLSNVDYFIIATQDRLYREFPVGAFFHFRRQNSHIKIPKFLPQPPIPAVLATPTVAWLYQLY